MARPPFPFLIPTLPAVQDWAWRLEKTYAAGQYSNGGPLFKDLNEKLRINYLHPDYEALTVTSNTLGLQAVMQALGLRGKRVGLPDFTFAATIQAVLAAGGIPVIFDVDPSTLELCAEGVAEYLEAGGRLDAVVHVRCFGFARDISPIKNVAKRYSIPLIIDAAAALGIPGERTFGSADGEIEVFSLHATKVFAIGEGGLIGAPVHLHERISAATNFGFQPDRRYLDGTNAKIDEFRCAIGLTMLDRLETLIKMRRAHALHYLGYFNENSFGMPICQDIQNSWSMFPVLFNDPVSDSTVSDFLASGVEVKRYYYPSVSRGYIGSEKLEIISTTNTDHVHDRILCFPIYALDPETYWSDLRSRIHPVLSRQSQVVA